MAAAPPMAVGVDAGEKLSQAVRALNRQFGSWVRTQLTAKPQSTWTEGIEVSRMRMRRLKMIIIRIMMIVDAEAP
jgi:hypothetical protein